MDTRDFEFNGHHFRPIAGLDGASKNMLFKHIGNKLLFEDFSHSAFYKAGGNDAKGIDIFLCIENLNLYIPTGNGLFEYCEYAREDPAKTKENGLFSKRVYDALPEYCYIYDHYFCHILIQGRSDANAILSLYSSNDGEQERQLVQQLNDKLGVSAKQVGAMTALYAYYEYGVFFDKCTLTRLSTISQVSAGKGSGSKSGKG